MKKSLAKTLAAAIALALILPVLAVPAFAATARYDFGTYYGYFCTGVASVSSSYASVNFHAEANPNIPRIPEDDCFSKVCIEVFSTSGTYLGMSESTGKTSASVTSKITDYEIGYIQTSFTFNSSEWADKILYA